MNFRRCSHFKIMILDSRWVTRRRKTFFNDWIKRIFVLMSKDDSAFRQSYNDLVSQTSERSFKQCRKSWENSVVWNQIHKSLLVNCLNLIANRVKLCQLVRVTKCFFAIDFFRYIWQTNPQDLVTTLRYSLENVGKTWRFATECEWKIV